MTRRFWVFIAQSVQTLWTLIGVFPFPASSICYYPDGSVSPQDTPCEDTTEQSTCCGEGYACLSNNICMNTSSAIQQSGSTEYVRGSCTDQTWRSSYCPLFCINPDSPNKDDTGGGEGIGKCPDTTKDMYYCIDYNLAAVNCSAEQNVLVFQGTPSVITTIGVSQTTSIISSTTLVSTSLPSPSETATVATASASSSPSSTRSPARATNAGTIAGSVCGSVVGVVAIAGLILFVWRRKKLHVFTDQPEALQPLPEIKIKPEGHQLSVQMYQDGGERHEVVGDEPPRHELPTFSH